MDITGLWPRPISEDLISEHTTHLRPVVIGTQAGVATSLVSRVNWRATSHLDLILCVTGLLERQGPDLVQYNDLVESHPSLRLYRSEPARVTTYWPLRPHRPFMGHPHGHVF
jgi:hypothetical protein